MEGIYGGGVIRGGGWGIEKSMILKYGMAVPINNALLSHHTFRGNPIPPHPPLKRKVCEWNIVNLIIPNKRGWG